MFHIANLGFQNKKIRVHLIFEQNLFHLIKPTYAPQKIWTI